MFGNHWVRVTCFLLSVPNAACFRNIIVSMIAPPVTAQATELQQTLHRAAAATLVAFMVS